MVKICHWRRPKFGPWRRYLGQPQRASKRSVGVKRNPEGKTERRKSRVSTPVQSPPVVRLRRKLPTSFDRIRCSGVPGSLEARRVAETKGQETNTQTRVEEGVAHQTAVSDRRWAESVSGNMCQKTTTEGKKCKKKCKNFKGPYESLLGGKQIFWVA